MIPRLAMPRPGGLAYCMPKLHDMCQILAEEILDRLSEFSKTEAPFVLALVYHAIEDDLSQHHPEAEVIAVHMWQVLEETIEQQHPELELVAVTSQAPIEEDDIRLGYLIHSAIQSVHSLFPTNRNIIFS